MIKIQSDAYNRSVRLSSLCVGDTFLLEGNVCMIASRNGHPFVLDLSTGEDYPQVNPTNNPRPVVPIDCELSYKVGD